ncbi:hypothetical protein SEA_GREENWEASEL_67 [Streptomyces phage GreenWeasel]|nr:hypothetical protein SEA_GREENWEASEL_67 [Streptomyces phage GreenWeasel]
MIAAALSSAFSAVKSLTPRTTVVIALGAGLVVGAATPISEQAPVAQSFTLADTKLSTVNPDLLPETLPTRECSLDSQIVTSCYFDPSGEAPAYIRDEYGKVLFLDPALNDWAERADWDAVKQAAGWEDWGTVDGHPLCWAKVGDTSYVECFDGYETTS